MFPSPRDTRHIYTRIHTCTYPGSHTSMHAHRHARTRAKKSQPKKEGAPPPNECVRAILCTAAGISARRGQARREQHEAREGGGRERRGLRAPMRACIDSVAGREARAHWGTGRRAPAAAAEGVSGRLIRAAAATHGRPWPEKTPHSPRTLSRHARTCVGHLGPLFRPTLSGLTHAHALHTPRVLSRARGCARAHAPKHGGAKCAASWRAYPYAHTRARPVCARHMSSAGERALLACTRPHPPGGRDTHTRTCTHAHT